MKRITIALVDDEALFRKGMSMLIGDYDDFEVVLEAKHGQNLLEQMEQIEELPDVILMDMQMPVMNGIEATKALQEKYNEIKIVILTTHYSKAFILNMLELGASSYLPKNSDPDEVINTLRGVYEKGFYYNDHVMKVIRENMTRKAFSKSKVSKSPELTKREREVLQLICEQNTTAEIAEKLFISRRTVDGHRNNLLDKTGSKNVAGLVVFAIENRIVQVKSQNIWDTGNEGNSLDFK